MLRLIHYVHIVFERHKLHRRELCEHDCKYIDIADIHDYKYVLTHQARQHHGGILPLQYDTTLYILCF
jgi:hypothetical protein